MSGAIHRYPFSWLMSDYLRGGGGLLLTGAPLLLARPTLVFSLILGGLALLFALFLARTAQRQATIYLRDGEGLVRKGPIGPERRLAWRELSTLNLKYFSTQRNRENGWLLLTLKDSAGTAMQLESPLEGFAELIAQALQAAGEAGVSLSQTTIDNLTAAGYRHRAER